MGEGGKNQGKGTGNKKIKWQVQDRRDVKNSIRTGEAKELICTTHRHELRWEMLVGGGLQVRGRIKKMGQL